MSEKKNPKLIHVAIIQAQHPESRYLFLRQVEDLFKWFYVDQQWQETESEVTGNSSEEALRLGRRQWKDRYFRTLICGFRYSLPERDEHGLNALFYQMAASYNTGTGIYFDEDAGHNCIVQNASMEARELFQKLKELGKL